MYQGLIPVHPTASKPTRPNAPDTYQRAVVYVLRRGRTGALVARTCTVEEFPRIEAYHTQAGDPVVHTQEILIPTKEIPNV